MEEPAEYQPPKRTDEEQSLGLLRVRKMADDLAARGLPCPLCGNTKWMPRLTGSLPADKLTVDLTFAVQIDLICVNKSCGYIMSFAPLDIDF